MDVLTVTVWLLPLVSVKNVNLKIVLIVKKTAVFVKNVTLDLAFFDNQRHQYVFVIHAKKKAAINARNQSLKHAIVVHLVMDSFLMKMEKTFCIYVNHAQKKTVSIATLTKMSVTNAWKDSDS